MSTQSRIFQVFVALALLMNFMAQVTLLWLPDPGPDGNGKTIQICTTQGLQIGREITAPVYQDLNGPQMKRDWTSVIALQYRF